MLAPALGDPRRAVGPLGQPRVDETVEVARLGRHSQLAGELQVQRGDDEGVVGPSATDVTSAMLEVNHATHAASARSHGPAGHARPARWNAQAVATRVRR